MAEQRKGDHKDPKIGNDDALRQLTSHDGDDLFLKDGNEKQVEWVYHQGASFRNEQEPLSRLPGDHYPILTDRNAFFCVAPFDVVHGNDQIVESSYGGGNRTVGVSNDSTSRGVVVSSILEQENPVIGLANVGITSSDMIDERQEHEMGSNCEFEEDLVNDGWWEKWDENKGLQAQLRDTAEAVQAAGELLVRLKEAEEAVAAAEARAREAEQEKEKAYKQIESLKRKQENVASPPLYDMPMYDDKEPNRTSDDPLWRNEYENFYSGNERELTNLPGPSSWSSGYDTCNI